MRSIVLQNWLAAHGDRRDLIVGVKRPNEEFEAHAWLEGEPPHGDCSFHELLRRPVTSPNFVSFPSVSSQSDSFD